MKRKLYVWIILIAIVVLLLSLPTPEGLTVQGQRAITLVVIAAFIWLGELLPIGAGSLLIIALAPIMGILETSRTFQSFSSDIIFLYIGGFIVAASMALHGLDKRIALSVMVKTGTNKQRVVLGLMLGTALISAWLSSVVVVLALLPIVLGMLKIMGTKPGDPDGKLFLLALAYSALTGGMATPVGTAPNALVMGFLRDMAGIDITFVGWMAFGVPLAVITTFVTWWILVNVSFKVEKTRNVALEDYVKGEYEKLGSMERKERMSLYSMLLFALLLFTVPLGKQFFGAAYWSEGIASLISTLPLFLSGSITWKQANEGISWGVLLLFTAGLSISAGLNLTGAGLYLAEIIGTTFSAGMLPIIFPIFGALFTQMTSNTATTAILAPIAISIALVSGINPMVIAIPTTLGILIGFLTPIASALNPVVFGQMPDGNTYLAKVSDFTKGGIVSFVVCLALIILYSVYITPLFF